MTDEPVKPDAQIGRNVNLIRAGRTQKEVAAGMRDRGWRWTQSTVWSIESGERSVKLAEATDLATVLDVGVPDLLREDDSVVVSQCYSRVMSARLALERAAGEFIEATTNLAFAADSAADRGRLDGRAQVQASSALEDRPETIVRNRVAADWAPGGSLGEGEFSGMLDQILGPPTDG